MSKEKPMLFSAPMVVALDERRKTQTRRIMKIQPTTIENGAPFWTSPFDGNLLTERQIILGSCPYGVIGDRLWVRENWQTGIKYNHLPPRDIPKTAPIEYLATDKLILSGNIRPNIFMCRWMSRFLLEITDIRVQRVQEISVSDIEAEGVSINLFESMLEPIAKKLKVDEPHWICHYEMDECGTFCFKCGEKRRKQLLKNANEDQKHNLESLDGGWTTEFDSAPRCETCEMPLHYFPTDYCFEEEMEHFMENGCYPNPLDAYEMLALTRSTNMPTQENEHKFLKIAWRFLWNSINDNWDDNPWVWAITFKRTENV